MGAPISDFANTPFATVVARVARVVGDGSDSDRAPDFLPASGEIVFTPNIKFSKLEVDNKSVIVLNEPVRCTIDPVTGYMIGPDGGYGVRLVASSGANIEPQGLGYTVTFRGAETRIPEFSIFLEAGEVVDLAKILPVDLQPGIVTTVSSKTVDAVEQALIRLNSLQENVSYAVKSIPDMFRWDGTTLLINGNPGPDLGRITDEKLEEVNNTIDSLAQAHSDLMNGYIETQHSFVELDDKLGQAFPDSIFDVNLAIEQAKDLSEQRFADAITGTVVEYAVSTSETVAPTSGWSPATPTRTPGSYVWMRTTVSYGSGNTTTTEPVLLTGNDGTPAVLLRIDSSRGTAFKNNMISTVLSVTIFLGDEQINNIHDLHDRLGPAYYLEWFWRRLDDEEFGLISSSDDRLGSAGFTLTVSPDDVDEQTVFQCILKQ